MEDFQHKNKILKFWAVSGEVLSQNKYSQTNVSTSGGGGYVGPEGGTVNAPEIHTEIVTNHEFWIKRDNGTEKCIQLSGCNIPLRAGHRITVISTGNKESDNGYYSILVNHNVEKYWWIKNATQLNSLLKIDLLTGKSLFIGIVIGILLIIADPKVPQVGLIAGCGFIISRFIYKVMSQKKLISDLDTHLSSIAKKQF